MQPSCSCRNKNVLCHDTKFVATSSFYTYVSGNYHDKHFSLSRQDFFSSLIISVPIEFSMSQHDFFSGPYPWLSCLLQHRDLCCYKLDLANLSSFSIFVTIKFSSIATKFYQPGSFYCRDIKLLCRDKDFAFNISLCRNMNFFVVIPLVLLFNFYVVIENSLSRQNSP